MLMLKLLICETKSLVNEKQKTYFFQFAFFNFLISFKIILKVECLVCYCSKRSSMLIVKLLICETKSLMNEKHKTYFFQFAFFNFLISFKILLKVECLVCYCSKRSSMFMVKLLICETKSLVNEKHKTYFFQFAFFNFLISFKILLKVEYRLHKYYCSKNGKQL